MTGYRRLAVAQIPYLYVEHTCGKDPGAIRAAMRDALATVSDFMRQHEIRPTGAPMAVHDRRDPDKMTFRAGFPVGKADALRASGPVRFDTTPAGEALCCRHIGPFTTLRACYGKMAQHMQRNGLEMAGPTWEVYLDDPEEMPEEALRIEVFVALKEDAVAHGRRRSGAL